MADHSRKNPTSRIFSHLTPEERIEQACELLAIGVLRLAEKEGLLKRKQENKEPEQESTCRDDALHQTDHLKLKVTGEEITA